jgi:pantoate kinase
LIEHRSGGHITLLFSIDKTPRLPRSQGSLGAGFTIHHGVIIKARLIKDDRTSVTPQAGSQPEGKQTHARNAEVHLTVTDAQGEAVENPNLYLDLIEGCREATLLRPHEGLEAEISIECPLSQGFGMSAAGLMAMGNVLHQLTGRGRLNQYYKIAHRIERQHGAGLGDVLGASVGGIELRLQPGAPGWPGQAVSFSADIPVLLVWDDGGAKHTSDYIDNPEWQRSITRAGLSCMEALKVGEWERGRWKDLLHQSQQFSQQSGMMDEAVRAQLHGKVATTLVDLGLQGRLAVRLCMLGTSVAVLPRSLEDVPGIEEYEHLGKLLQATGRGVLLTGVAPVTTTHQKLRDRED